MWRIVLTCGLYLILLLSDLSLSQTVLADSLNPEKAAQKVEQAADKIVQDEQKDTTKETYGEYEESNEMIDQAREKAQKNLKTLANDARKEEKSDGSLPSSKKVFLKKFEQQ